MSTPPLSAMTIRRIHAMRADGYTCKAVGAMVGCSRHVVQKLAPGRPGKVPNDRLREAFLASPVTASSVARYLGWYSTNGRRDTFPDTSRVRRTLGLLPTTSGHGITQNRRLIDWETGSLIAEAIGVAAWSVLDDDADVAA